MMSLAKYLERENLTQRAFAAQLEISPSHMNEVIRGVKSPTMKLATKIVRLTGGEVSFEALASPINAMPAPTPPEPASAQSEDAA